MKKFTVMIGTPDMKGAGDFRRWFEENGIEGCEKPYDGDILSSPSFTVADIEMEVPLIVCEVSALGFVQRVSLELICSRAWESGLLACVAEAGVQFRRQYTAQPEGERLTVVVLPDESTNLPLFDVERDNGLKIRGYHIYPGNFFTPDARLVFSYSGRQLPLHLL